MLVTKSDFVTNLLVFLSLGLARNMVLMCGQLNVFSTAKFALIFGEVSNLLDLFC